MVEEEAAELVQRQLDFEDFLVARLSHEKVGCWLWRVECACISSLSPWYRDAREDVANTEAANNRVNLFKRSGGVGSFILITSAPPD